MTSGELMDINTMLKTNSLFLFQYVNVLVLLSQFLDSNQFHYTHLASSMGSVGYTLFWDAFLVPWIGMPPPAPTLYLLAYNSILADYVVEGHVNKCV